MYAHVVLRTGDGRTVRLGHGDFIGRLWSAALCVDDPRVSEAHAMVSLRMGELRLLALRGRFTTGRRLLADVRLVPGLKIALTAETSLEVVSVNLPRRLLAIEGDGLDKIVLPGACGLVTSPAPALVSPIPEDPAASFWHNGSGWRIRPRGQPTRALLLGDSWESDGRCFRAVAWELRRSSDGVTAVDDSFEHPLRLVAHYDTVHVHHGNRQHAVLSGIGARIVSELVVFGGPVQWRVLAGEIWGDLDEAHLRRRFDTGVGRLRRRLRELGLRPDLVRTTGTGHCELFLSPRDVVEDRT